MENGIVKFARAQKFKIFVSPLGHLSSDTESFSLLATQQRRIINNPPPTILAQIQKTLVGFSILSQGVGELRIAIDPTDLDIRCLCGLLEA